MNNISRSKMSKMGLPVALFVCLMGLTWGCEKKETGKAIYERLEKAELAKNQRFDTIFWGYYFGMDRIAFFEKCRILN